MPTKLVPCQVYLPNKLNAEVLKVCKKMENDLGEYYSKSRFFREAAVWFIVNVEKHGRKNTE